MNRLLFAFLILSSVAILAPLTWFTSFPLAAQLTEWSSVFSKFRRPFVTDAHVGRVVHRLECTRLTLEIRSVAYFFSSECARPPTFFGEHDRFSSLQGPPGENVLDKKGNHTYAFALFSSLLDFCIRQSHLREGKRAQRNEKWSQITHQWCLSFRTAPTQFE